MIIRQIKIKNFGQYSDFTLNLPERGLNLIAEANEYGKTTLAEFVRRMLFGFPDGRSSLNPYPAADAKNYGGSLTVECGNDVFEIERLNGRLRILRDQAEVTDPAAFLKEHLTVSDSFYRNVYAITIDELNQVKLLDETEIRSRLYGAGLSLGNVSIDRIQSDLGKRAAALYVPRGQKHQAAQISREIELLEAKLRAVNDQLPEYEAATASLSDGQQQKTELATELDSVNQELKELDRLRQCFAAGQKLPGLRQQLKEFGMVEIVPVEQWELGLEKIKLAIRQNREQQQKIAQQLLELPEETAVAPETILKELALQELGNRFFVYDRDLEDLAKLQAEPRARTFIKVWIGIVAVAVAIILLGLLSHFLLVLIGAVLLLPCWFLRLFNQEQLAKRQNHDERVAAMQARIDEFEDKFAAHFAGHAPDRQLLQQTLLDVTKIKKDAEKIRLSSESLAIQQQHLEVDAEHLERSLNDFFRSRQCENEASYRQKIADFVRYREIRQNCETMQKHLTEIFGAELLAKCANCDQPELDRQYEQCLQRQKELTGRLAELSQNFGSASQVVGSFQRLPDATVLRNELEGLYNQRREIYRQYLIVTQAAKLLDLAIAKFEKERQPQVIRHAETLFQNFTAGRYANLRKTLDGELLVFDTATKADKTPLQLSRGTMDLLMLSLRLALIEYCEESGPALPVILDDVSVNIDSQRTAALMRTLETFAVRRQVLFLCKK